MCWLVVRRSLRRSHRVGSAKRPYEVRDQLLWLYAQGVPKSRVRPGGLGVCLKPAYEPVLLARKPLAGTLDANLAAHGTGALQIDAARVPRRDGGRGFWPANVALAHSAHCRRGGCLPDCPVALIDTEPRPGREVSRLFFASKASRAEREAGCEALPLHQVPIYARERGSVRLVRNTHPTVKPLELMRWLTRLVCPPGGTVLDPFTGSGSTGAAVVLEGRRFVGIERDGRYVQKAAEYGAVVVDEYIERAESAKTNQRPELNVMLRRIKEERDIDYVILWKVDRFARNRRDDANMLFEIELAGARLISATENIDQTPAGRLMHGMLASFAEYYSRNLANEVLKGMTEKAKRGGTPGRTRLGYLNIREQLPQGGEVRTVIIDPERGRIITWAFETYATGLYSLSDIAILLEARGLRSRGTRRRDPQPLSLNGVHNLLCCPYYAGIVSYAGKQYPGRHEPLVSQELFDQVQAVLAAHRLSGERDRKHQHYLKGTIRCGTCGCRLVYSRNKGNGGIYEYFVCPRNQRGECPQRCQPVDLVEAAIEDHYAGVPFSDAEREEIRQAIAKDLSERVATAQQEIDRCQGVLQAIKDQERKLLNMHYEDRISGELFDDEQARLRRERQDAEGLIARLSLRYDDIVATLDLALKILDEDLHDLYLRADDTIRRLINQAIFNALFVCDETITAAELAGPFAELRALHNAIRATTSSTPIPAPAEIAATTAFQHAEAPVPWREREPLDVGSIYDVMVGRVGIEPTTLGLRGPCSAG